MSDVVVYAVNEVFLRFSCEDAIKEEISEYFTFFVPGYQYSPKFKKKLWDGKIRLANRRTQLLYRGLLKHLQDFCKERDYSIAIDDACLLQEEFSLHEGKQFIETLNLPATIDQTDREYQLETFVKSIRNKRHLFISPTGSGKSLILYYIVRYLQFKGFKRGLLVVPTTALVEQMYGDFKSYGWDHEEFVHRLYQGKVKQTNKFLMISTWQSLYNNPPEYFEQFDFIIGDEAHTFKATSLKYIMENLVNTRVRIGCTGTLDGTKTNKLVLEGLFGPVEQAVTTKELIDKGLLAQLTIKCLILKYPDHVCQTFKKDKYDYDREIDYIVTSDARNKFIRNLALSLKGNTLILYQFVEKHGKILHALIEEANPYRELYFVCKDTSALEREAIRHAVEKSNSAIIVASYGTFSTGTNIKNLHNAILASPSKGSIRNLQSIGRILRTTKDKSSATLFDIVDDLRVGKQQNFCLRHFVERATIYNKQKFKYKLYQIDLKGATINGATGSPPRLPKN